MNSCVIKIFCDYCESYNYAQQYSKIMDTSFLYKYKNLNISFTGDNDYTHAIIINTCMPSLNIPKENVVGLAYEPIYFLGLNDTFIEYAKNNIGKYFIGDKGDLPFPFIEHYSYMFHDVVSPKIENYVIPNKLKFCSIIISVNKKCAGHIYRHRLVEEILKTDLPIDIYGGGSHFYNSYNDSRVKSVFEPYDTTPTINYKFHICIENFRSNHYFSEKIINPLLMSTIPIYYGCYKIEEYFPNNVIHLTGNVEDDINLLRDIFNNENDYVKNINVDEVIKTTNLFNNLDKLFTPFLQN